MSEDNPLPANAFEAAMGRLTTVAESNSFGAGYWNYPRPEATMIADIRNLLSALDRLSTRPLAADGVMPVKFSVTEVEAAIRQTRHVALEEAAKLSEQHGGTITSNHAAYTIAAAIRSLSAAPGVDEGRL